ncbi:MAG: oligosaccharide flippase family protein, partial [Elusimicrobia bacterium]|nr:oligosaccharide flippase family protein [Elusimicrobiota bacterium]
NLLLGIHRVRSYNAVEIATRSLNVGFLAVLILARSVTVVNVFVAGLAATFLTGAWAFLQVRGVGPGAPRWSRSLFSATVGYGFKAYLVSLFAYLIVRVDLLMVKYMLGATQAGYYSISASVADLLYILPATIGTILFPRISALTDPREKWRLARKSMLATIAVMVPLAIIACLLAKVVVRLLFGRAFLPAVPPFYVLAGAMIFYGANNMIAYLFAALEYPAFSIYAWGVVLVLNMGLNLFFIPQWGIVGAAWSSLVCYLGIFLLELVYVPYYLRRVLGPPTAPAS